jgi:serine/threonine-protein kinase RsbW
MSVARKVNSGRGREFAVRRAGSLLEIDTWIRSEIKGITPLVERLMRLIEGSHCITGEEPTVELALREALNNAIVHGNRLDARKLVHVRCRCRVGEGISIAVSDQGRGFDPAAVPDPLSVENLQSEHGRGIHIMKWAMDQVSFEGGGTEVHMWKGSPNDVKAKVNASDETANTTSRSYPQQRWKQME